MIRLCQFLIIAYLYFASPINYSIGASQKYCVLQNLFGYLYVDRRHLLPTASDQRTCTYNGYTCIDFRENFLLIWNLRVIPKAQSLNRLPI